MTKRTFAFAAGIAVLAVLASASMHAFPTTRYNDLTFNRPISLPGTTLAAGEYRFEIASDTGVVRVSNPRSQQPYFMGHTLPVSRPPSLGKDHLVTFGEAPEGQAIPVRVWFPRGGGDGRQFIY